MTDATDFRLRPESYTTCGVFGGIGAAHFERAHEVGGWMALLHGLYGVIAILPFIGWIMALIEWCVVASSKPTPSEPPAGGSTVNRDTLGRVRAVDFPATKPATAADSASRQGAQQAHSRVTDDKPIPTPTPQSPFSAPEAMATAITLVQGAAPSPAVASPSIEVEEREVTVGVAADRFLESTRKRFGELYLKRKQEWQEMTRDPNTYYRNGEDLTQLGYSPGTITGEGWKRIARRFLQEQGEKPQDFPMMTLPLRTWRGSSPGGASCLVLDIASLPDARDAKGCTILVFMALKNSSALHKNTGYIVFDLAGNRRCDSGLGLLREGKGDWVDEGQTFANPGNLEWMIRFPKQQPAAAAASSSSSSSSSAL